VPALTAHFLAAQTTERVRPHILHVLRHLGGKWFEDEMLAAMQSNPQLSIRRQCVWVLGELGVVSALPAMLDLLEAADTEDEMKVELLLALRKILSKPLDIDLVEQIRAAAAKQIEWHDGGSPGIIENAIQVVRICDRKLS
jgi:HEAT repeat protein